MQIKTVYALFHRAKKEIFSKLVQNSLWGVGSSLLQNIFYSLFFIIVARIYSKTDFATYIIVNAMYGMVGSFASMGLGQWFTREMVSASDPKEHIARFFKLQFVTGILFYLIAIIITFILYDDPLIRRLSFILSINIIFDNIIYVIKNVNIFQQEQKRSFYILITEAALKFIIGCFLFFYKFSFYQLSLVLILIRLISLNLFIKYGISGVFAISRFIKSRIDFFQLFKILRVSWVFIIIGGISVIYWRIGSILTSKFLSIENVADYEVSFKLFSIAEIIPFIFSSSLFPQLVRAFKMGQDQLRALYDKLIYIYTLFGLLCFTFILSYADDFIPILFGSSYSSTPKYTSQMFMTILVYPTVLLQANILVSMKLEKVDMWLNIASLLSYLIFSVIGLVVYKGLSVLILSIFFSFVIFHLLQDIILLKMGVTTWRKIAFLYFFVCLIAGSYYLLSNMIGGPFLYPIFWLLFILTWSISRNIKLQKK